MMGLLAFGRLALSRASIGLQTRLGRREKNRWLRELMKEYHRADPEYPPLQVIGGCSHELENEAGDV